MNRRDSSVWKILFTIMVLLITLAFISRVYNGGSECFIDNYGTVYNVTRYVKIDEGYQMYYDDGREHIIYLDEPQDIECIK